MQLNTAKLKHEIGLTYSRYMGYRQHDAHELLIGKFVEISLMTVLTFINLLVSLVTWFQLSCVSTVLFTVH